MKIYIIQQHLPDSDGLDYFKVFLDKEEAYIAYQKLVQLCEDQVDKEWYQELFEELYEDDVFDQNKFDEYFSDIIKYPHYDGIIPLSSSGYLSFIESESGGSEWFRSRK